MPALISHCGLLKNIDSRYSVERDEEEVRSRVLQKSLSSETLDLNTQPVHFSLYATA